MAVADMLAALRIKANLIADKAVGLMDIRTEVHEGVAILTGEVETDEQKRIAEELASKVEGVHEVENEIRVLHPGAREESDDQDDAHLGYGPAEGDAGDTAFSVSGAYNAPGPGVATSEQFPGEFTDEEVEQHVKSRLASQRRVNVSDIQIRSENQIVHVAGTVGTPDDLNELRDVITSARGVMGVQTDVKVRRGEIGTPAD